MMGLDIVFGWHLDGATYPETASGSQTSLGSLVVGPAGLTDQLAMRLGLERAPVSHAVRVARYMAALSSCDNGGRFYSKSFGVDPWSTAISLLAMRDQLIVAGWSGGAFGDVSPRLRTLADVEKHCLVSSPAELFRDVLCSLRTGPKKLPIKAIKLTAPIALLPAAWQELLVKLASTGIKIEEAEEQSKALGDGTDLGRIQRFLQSGELTQLAGDGTFCLLESDDEYQLSEAVALWLLNSKQDRREIVFIRANPTSILDEYCHNLGLPKPGKYGKSRWRSHLQLLPLAFENRWLPAHPLRLLEFLALQQIPVHPSVARHFKWALHKEPGFGGEEWASAWNKVETELRQSSGDEDTEELNQTRINSLIRQMRFWIEPNRYLSEEGMPATEAIEVCKNLSKWASSSYRGLANDNLNLTHLIELADNTQEAITATGLSRIKKIQLDRILDTAIGEGATLDNRYAEAAEWSLVEEPGQIWGEAGTILWWGFTGKAASTSINPWTQSERQALADSGIHIEPSERDIVRSAHSWRQAILCAKDAILLARPRVRLGEITAIHPLWHELNEFVDSHKEAVITQAHEVLSQPYTRLGQHEVKLSQVEQGHLPAPRRYWTVSENTVVERAEESFSSIHDLLGCPMAWVLQYQARMHPTTLLVIPDGDQLIGEIAHRVFMRLFHPGSHTSDVSKAAGELFDEFVNAIGLPLLLPGRRFEMETAKRLIAKAAVEFAKLLKESDLEIEGCETYRETPFGGGKFIGQMDALLRDKQGRAFIVDYKWAKRLRYRLEEMQNGRQLQLAAYAWLQSRADGVYPDAGYFMLRQRRLLSTSPHTFESAQYIDSQSLETIWREAEKLYAQKIETLRKGTICATGVPEGAADPPLTMQQNVLVEPPCKFCDFGRICGAKEFPRA